LTYAANQIDLLSVTQQTATGAAQIARYTYNGQHRPLAYTDAAGRTTTYTYNAAGQLTSVTNALHQTTSYQYDTLGRLTTIINANGVVQFTVGARAIAILWLLRGVQSSAPDRAVRARADAAPCRPALRQPSIGAFASFTRL
jgi:YD repeat-containing protein